MALATEYAGTRDGIVLVRNDDLPRIVPVARFSSSNYCTVQYVCGILRGHWNNRYACLRHMFAYYRVVIVVLVVVLLHSQDSYA